MNIEQLTSIYTADTLDICRRLMRKGYPLSEHLTTPLGDKVSIHTQSHINFMGERVWETTVYGGPHNRTASDAQDAEQALANHWSSVYRHETGIHQCTNCNGSGQVERFADRVVWGPGGVAGHTTDHWTEDCDQCDDNGLAMDEDVTGTYIKDGEVV